MTRAPHGTHVRCAHAHRQECALTQFQSAVLALVRAYASLIDKPPAGASNARSGAATHAESAHAMSVLRRLKGKGGRFRQNLMGNRVDFCGRSVIVGDAEISLGVRMRAPLAGHANA